MFSQLQQEASPSFGLGAFKIKQKLTLSGEGNKKEEESGLRESSRGFMDCPQTLVRSPFLNC